MTYQEQLKKYCDDVLKKRIPTGIYTRKAIERFIKNLKRQKDDDFPYEFVPELAEEVIEFAESLHIPDIQREDGTNNLILLPWMLFIYYNIWGWRAKYDHSVRRYRSGYVEVARKNSKTTSILFPFILWDFLESPSAEAYFVSGDNAQSTKSFRELLHIVKSDPDLAKHIRETVYAITLNNSRIAFFSSESVAVDGYKNSLSIFDEYHEYTSGKIVSSFRMGGRARKNNLSLIITSAGTNINGPCYVENLRLKKILNEAEIDEKHFGIIYAYDDDDDWKDEANLIKANPSMGVILKKETLIDDIKLAISVPSEQPQTISKTCGIWTTAKSNWIPIQKWERNKEYKFDEKTLEGMDCWGAFDLSSVGDFTALTLYFKLPDGKYYAKHKFYIPADTIQEKYSKDNINIIGWVQGDDPLVTAIPGATIDQDVIFNDIVELAKHYHIRELAYDRWQSSMLVNKLNEELDITLVEYDQSLKKMSPATKKFEKAILDGEVVDNNPVMQWMLGNVVIKITANGDYKPLKYFPSSPDRIDGVITSIMAFDRLTENEGKPVQEFSIEQMLASI